MITYQKEKKINKKYKRTLLCAAKVYAKDCLFFFATCNIIQARLVLSWVRNPLISHETFDCFVMYLP